MPSKHLHAVSFSFNPHHVSRRLELEWLFISKVRKLTLAQDHTDDESLGLTNGVRLLGINCSILQSIFNIPGFYVLEFTYLLKFSSNSLINTCCTFVVIFRHGQRSQKSEPLNVHSLSWNPTRKHLVILSEFSYCKQMFFLRSTQGHFVSAFL